MLAPPEEAQALTLIFEIFQMRVMRVFQKIRKKYDNPNNEIETRIVLQRTNIRIFEYSGTFLKHIHISVEKTYFDQIIDTLNIQNTLNTVCYELVGHPILKP